MATWLVVFAFSWAVASGEVHAQETSDTLVDALSDRLEGAQPSREQFLQPGDRRGPNVIGAVADSFRLLSMQHGLRIALQQKTRQELPGPFFKDYRDSIRMPRTWGDGDGWLVNYVGHPSQGATSGWLWLHNEPGAETQKLGRSRRYWSSRGRALAWSAAYSVQFEIGPYSEASIGNVGLNPRTVGWTDYVTTPLGGVALIVAEDAVDEHVITKLERRTRQRPLRALYRSVLNPNRAMANLASGRWPWHRETRGLDEVWHSNGKGRFTMGAAPELPPRVTEDTPAAPALDP